MDVWRGDKLLMNEAQLEAEHHKSRRLIVELLALGAPDRAASRIVGRNAVCVNKIRQEEGFPANEDPLKYWNLHKRGVHETWEDQMPIRRKPNTALWARQFDLGAPCET